jgi:hypothetical protein
VGEGPVLAGSVERDAGRSVRLAKGTLFSRRSGAVHVVSNRDGRDSNDVEAATESSGSPIPDPREFLASPEDDHDDGDGTGTDGAEDDGTETDGPAIPSSEDVPRSVRLSFWWLVLVCNGLVLALFLGVMYGVFEGNWDLGGRLLAAGGVLGVYALFKYRTFPREELGTDGDDPEGDDEADGTEDEREGDGTANAESGDGTTTSPDPAPEEPALAPAGTVEDGDGNRYLLVKRSGESSLVRDPSTGKQQYLPNEDVEAVGESPLTAAAGSVPEPARRVLSATHDDRSLGLLVEVVDRGPVGVRSLLSDYDLCESDLHGLLTEFRAAGLVEEATVAGERGYGPTETAREGVRHLRATGRA